MATFASRFRGCFLGYVEAVMQKNASMFLVGPPPGRRKRPPGFLVCALYTWWMLRKTRDGVGCNNIPSTCTHG